MFVILVTERFADPFADVKVSAFEAAVKNSKPLLDKIDTKFATQYLDAVATAHESISQTLKKDPSAYSLVSVLTMLNDLSRQAANGGVLLVGADELQGKPVAGEFPSRTACCAASRRVPLWKRARPQQTLFERDRLRREQLGPDRNTGKKL